MTDKEAEKAVAIIRLLRNSLNTARIIMDSPEARDEAGRQVQIANDFLKSLKP